MHRAADSPPHRPRLYFSLAALLRTVTLVALALGWAALLPRVRPEVLYWLMLAAGAVLSAVVGYRRAGRPWRRILAGGAFMLNTWILALYTAYTANVIQNPVVSQHDARRNVDQAFDALPIVFGFPLVVVIAVLMLRSWTWSANDQLIHGRPPADPDGASDS